MSDYIYSPDEEESYPDQSEKSHKTIHDLQNAYERRRQATERQHIAINIWRKKVIFGAFLLIVTSGFLVFSQIWYANVVGIAGAFLGIYGAIKKNTEFVFVYMVLLALEFIKNIGIFIYYINAHMDFHQVLLMGVCLFEELVIVPMSMYYALKLYMSLNLENEDTEL
eukprot:117793_1